MSSRRALLRYYEFGVPPVRAPEPQAVADDTLPAAEEGLDLGADIVPGGFTASGIS